MKITKEVIQDFIVEVAGDDLPPLVDLLWKKKNISEFKLAENLNITVNQVRNMLYRLSNLNLVSFMRKKDKKKGWYIYYWTLEEKMVKDELVRFSEKKLHEFQDRLQKEQLNEYYVCPNRCVRLSYEQAMEQNFHCLECGSLLEKQDNVRTIENLRKRIDDLKAELAEVREEQEKREQRRIAYLIKEEEKRKAERLAKRREAAEKRRKEVAQKKKLDEKKKKIIKKKAVKKKTAKKVKKKKPKTVKKKVKKKKPKPVKKKIKKAVKKKTAKKSPSKKISKKIPKKSSKKLIKKKIKKKKR